MWFAASLSCGDASMQKLRERQLRSLLPGYNSLFSCTCICVPGLQIRLQMFVCAPTVYLAWLGRASHREKSVEYVSVHRDKYAARDVRRWAQNPQVDCTVNGPTAGEVSSGCRNVRAAWNLFIYAGEDHTVSRRRPVGLPAQKQEHEHIGTRARACRG